MLHRRELVGRYSVPGCCLLLRLGSHGSPGYFWDASWIKRRVVQPFPMSILDQAHNPRRLAAHHDDSDVSSCAYPYATVLGGIPWWVQGDRLSGPLHGVDGQSRPWGLCITPASGGEELHLYSLQVIDDPYGLDPSSLARRPFRGNGSQLRLVRSFPARRLRWPRRLLIGASEDFRCVATPLLPLSFTSLISSPMFPSMDSNAIVSGVVIEQPLPAYRVPSGHGEHQVDPRRPFAATCLSAASED
jgi:hypothetical protein